MVRTSCPGNGNRPRHHGGPGLVAVENLSDRQAADAVHGGIDGKDLPGLDLTDPGCDASVLSKFRTHLGEQHAEELLWEKMLTWFGQTGWLKARLRQRTAAIHVLAKLRAFKRVG
ncbi:MAG TPA: transposase [Ktedonobacteraceae bacterium]|jgi:transposase